MQQMQTGVCQKGYMSRTVMLLVVGMRHATTIAKTVRQEDRGPMVVVVVPPRGCWIVSQEEVQTRQLLLHMQILKP